MVVIGWSRTRRRETGSTRIIGLARRLTHGVRQFVEQPDIPRSRTERAVYVAWRWVKAIDTTRPRLLDASIAGAIEVAGVVSVAVLGVPGASPWILTSALAVPLAWRRRAPVSVFLVVAVVAFVQWLVLIQLAADVSLLIALFTVADERPRRVALAATAVLELGAVLDAVRGGPAETFFRSWVLLSGLVAAALFAGANLRARRAHVNALVERAEHLEFERDQQAQISTAAERTRIAREMHDVIAHSLAVMIALADGAHAKLTSDPNRADAALHDLSQLGREALDDTRRLLGVLRTSPTPNSRLPQPGVGDIPDLIRQVSATGLRAVLRIEGEPSPVAPGPGLHAFRIVQEAITNTLKHAQQATSVVVTLTYRGTQLDIDVVDDGRSVPSLPGPGGFGLEGIRERAAIYDGVATAGRRPEGGWGVHVGVSIAERSHS